MRPEDYRAFIRPMYLVAVLSQSFLLVAVPPNRRIVERARNFRHNLSHAIARQGYRLAGFAAYPADSELSALANHDSFKPFIDVICRGRVRQLEADRQREDERDAADMTQSLGAA